MGEFRWGSTMRVWPGRPYPLGATWDGRGVNFAVFSEHATRVELCLFDAEGHETRYGNHINSEEKETERNQSVEAVPPIRHRHGRCGNNA